MCTETCPDQRSEMGTRIVLKDVNVSRVLPSAVTEHPAVLHPSIYDLLVSDTYVAAALFYRLDPTGPTHFSKFIQTVKISLSKAVSVVYPMAGTWIVSEDAWLRKLVCNDAGPMFVEAKIDDDMDNVVDFAHFQPVNALLGGVAVPGFIPGALYQKFETNEFPSLIVQVTGFNCGGIALSFNYNHMTVDGFGFDRFLKAWCEILATGQTSVSPCCDRSLALSHFDCSWLGITPDMANEGDALGERLKRPSFPAVEHPACVINFSIRREVIEALQIKAKEDDPSSAHFSKCACIMASLWRCVARIPSSAEGWSSEDHAYVSTVIEGRKRWSTPQLPEDYIGNVFLWNRVPLLTSAELDNQTHAFAARKIRECVDDMNHEKAAKLEMLVKSPPSDEVKSQAPGARIKASNPIRPKRNLAPVISSWLRFDSFYELDFGYGKPFFFSPNGPPMAHPLDCIFLFPGPPGSNVGAGMQLQLTSEVMKSLAEDPEFQQLVS